MMGMILIAHVDTSTSITCATFGTSVLAIRLWLEMNALRYLLFHHQYSLVSPFFLPFSKQYLQWFGELIKEVVDVLKVLVRMNGKYKGPTQSGHQQQFQINANMSLVKRKDDLLAPYFGNVPVYKAGMQVFLKKIGGTIKLSNVSIGKYWRIAVYDKTGEPNTLVQDQNYELKVHPRASLPGAARQSLILDMMGYELKQ